MVVLWLAFALAMLLLMAMRLHTIRSYPESSTLYLISAVVSSLAGAALYKERQELLATSHDLRSA